MHCPQPSPYYPWRTSKSGGLGRRPTGSSKTQITPATNCSACCRLSDCTAASGPAPPGSGTASSRSVTIRHTVVWILESTMLYRSVNVAAGRRVAGGWWWRQSAVRDFYLSAVRDLSVSGRSSRKTSSVLRIASGKLVALSRVRLTSVQLARFTEVTTVWTRWF